MLHEEGFDRPPLLDEFPSSEEGTLLHFSVRSLSPHWLQTQKGRLSASMRTYVLGLSNLSALSGQSVFVARRQAVRSIITECLYTLSCSKAITMFSMFYRAHIHMHVCLHIQVIRLLYSLFLKNIIIINILQPPITFMILLDILFWEHFVSNQLSNSYLSLRDSQVHIKWSFWMKIIMKDYFERHNFSWAE